MNLYSKAEDCFELAKYLDKKMGSKISFYGSIYNEVIEGTYFYNPLDRSNYSRENGLPFYYKFCKEGFLRIQVGSYDQNNNSLGEKLAALSVFYETLSEVFGEPTVFYTVKNNREGGTLSLHWSFVNKEEEKQKFRDRSCFDDAEIDKLIIIGDKSSETNIFKLNETTKKYITKEIGLPFELINLLDENIEDFVKYKKENNIIRTRKNKN